MFVKRQAGTWFAAAAIQVESIGGNAAASLVWALCLNMHLFGIFVTTVMAFALSKLAVLRYRSARSVWSSRFLSMVNSALKFSQKG